MKNFGAVLSLFAVLVSAACAQEVGRKDLTRPLPPSISSERANSSQPEVPKECPQGLAGAFADGVVVTTDPAQREHLELAIVELGEPGSDTLTVTVRLKNVGNVRAVVPWSEEPLHSIADNEKGYYSASISLEFPTADNSESGLRVESRAELHRADGVANSTIDLFPGQWITLTLKGTLKCKNGGKLPCESHTERLLTASWSEHLFTTEVRDCTVVHGAFESRRLRSEPRPVTFSTRPASE